jgi:hypothetical protein
VIQFFKLSNGEEIIAEVQDEQDQWGGTVEWTKPHRLIVSDRGTGLMPLPCDKITVPKTSILFSGDLNYDLANVYRQATGKISVPPSSLQIPRG